MQEIVYGIRFNLTFKGNHSCIAEVLQDSLAWERFVLSFHAIACMLATGTWCQYELARMFPNSILTSLWWTIALAKRPWLNSCLADRTSRLQTTTELGAFTHVGKKLLSKFVPHWRRKWSESVFFFGGGEKWSGVLVIVCELCFFYVRSWFDWPIGDRFSVTRWVGSTRVCFAQILFSIQTLGVVLT